MSRADRQILAARIATAVPVRYSRIRESVIAAARPILAEVADAARREGRVAAGLEVARRLPCARRGEGRGCVIPRPGDHCAACAVCLLVDDLTVGGQDRSVHGPAEVFGDPPADPSLCAEAAA